MHVETKLSKMRENLIRASNEILSGVEEKFTIVRKERCPKLERQGSALARKWSHAIARGWATLLLDRLRDFVVVPSSTGGNSSRELHSQSTDDRATLDRHHHFHGHSCMSA